MPRPNMKALVEASWKKNGIAYPPAVGDKVKCWDPLELRGKSGKVIATDKASLKETIKVAPKDKIRVLVDGESKPFAKNQVFPNSLTVKAIEKMLDE